MTKTRNYVYPSKRSYQFVGAGPWEIRLRDKQGRRWTWRAGLSWNQAQRIVKTARQANYRDPVISRAGRRM